MRNLPQHAHTPVIFLTTENDKEKKLEAKSLGLFAWINQPYTVQKFMVDNALYKGRLVH